MRKFLHIIVLNFIVLLLLPQNTKAQNNGFTDRFDDETLKFHFGNSNREPHLLWQTVTSKSYGLSEIDGILKINFNRSEGQGAFDHFTFNPLRPLDVSENPRIRMDLKSNVEATLTARPAYSKEPPTVEYIEKEIPGDNQWHTYTFNLTPDYYKDNKVHRVDFYLDRGKAAEKTGAVEMDNFRIAWFLVKATDVKAKLKNGNNVQLSWNSTNEEQASSYKIYRANSPDFQTSEENFLAETDGTGYSDNNLDAYNHYFYKIVPVGTDGEEFFPSEEVVIETFIPGVEPLVEIAMVNTDTVKKYEKFELELTLTNVGIENPYDPEDIDVYAEFISPSGKEIRINGFYDNFRGADSWKIRFSPNEAGEYNYRIFARDKGGTGQTDMNSFTAVDSDHNGWIKPSDNNPHYFEHDDGTSYYPVGVYSPWRNDRERFETFAKYDANFFAMWDIVYGGYINGYGLIEEELGRYNQEKLGRMDSMLTYFEQEDIKLMFAVWPHDLFSETVWAAQWKLNPYSRLIDVEDVYSDSLVWEYQKQKYRYLIARFAHSRSWGIWELINEMNGTDGWAQGRHEEAYEWVRKAQKYFTDNDPYGHPMTASFSGGFDQYREELHEIIDVPNLHLYPTQGWKMKYPEDSLRSALYNYVWATQRFRNTYEKPAIFGEAGNGWSYFKKDQKKYRIMYHNVIWGTLANGLAGIPVWWSYTYMTEQDWQHLQYLSHFVEDIDFANLPYKPVKATADGTDIYVMDSDNHAFGWGRTFSKEDLSGTKIKIEKPGNGKFKVQWYNTWTGKIIKTENENAENGKLEITVPKMKNAKPDVAFKLIKN